MVKTAYLLVGEPTAKNPASTGRTHRLLGGLTLPERAAYLLAQLGVQRAVMVGIEDTDHILSRRPGPPIELQSTPQTELAQVLAVHRPQGKADEPVLVLRCDRIYGKNLLAAATRLDVQPGRVAALSAPPPADKTNKKPQNTSQDEQTVPVGIIAAHENTLASLLEEQVLPTENAAAAKDSVDQTSTQRNAVAGYQDLLERARRRDLVDHHTPQMSETKRTLFWFPVETENDFKPARDALFRSLGKPIDGFISRHLNRPVSQAVSKRICNYSFTPNQISAVVFMIGLAAAGVTLLMDWIFVAIGAVLFHAASVFDGVDGEIARVKFQSTKFGALLDSILDHIVMVAWILAIGYVIYWRGGPFLYPILGYVTLFGTAVGSAMVNYEQIFRTSSGQPLELQWDFEKEEHKDKFVSKLINSIRFFVSRDIDCVVLGLFALFNFLKPIPFIGATVASVYFFIVLGHQIRRLFKKPASSSTTGEPNEQGRP